MDGRNGSMTKEQMNATIGNENLDSQSSLIMISSDPLASNAQVTQG